MALVAVVVVVVVLVYGRHRQCKDMIQNIRRTGSKQVRCRESELDKTPLQVAAPLQLTMRRVDVRSKKVGHVILQRRTSPYRMGHCYSKRDCTSCCEFYLLAEKNNRSVRSDCTVAQAGLLYEGRRQGIL